MEESEVYETFDQNDRAEFLFNLFKNICLGGSLCQFEDHATEYLDLTKALYKDLISVTKDPSTNQIKILSEVFKIHTIQVFRIF